MLDLGKRTESGTGAPVRGEFTDIDGERFYLVRNCDRLPPFFMTVVSHDDHWLFASSTGGLTAGRVSPDTALFPYVPVDRIHDSSDHTGSVTLIRAERGGRTVLWQPFKRELTPRARVTRNLFKNTLGNKLGFEEIDVELGLTFRYVWTMSAEHGFVRRCSVRNTGAGPVRLEIIDGLRNILPAGTPRVAQSNSSNLVDAYKWSEQDPATGLGMFALFSGITDRAEPHESLRATTVFSLGLDDPTVLLSTSQLAAFAAGANVAAEHRRRGARGAYLVHDRLSLEAGASRDWRIVADIEHSQAEVVAMRRRLEADRASLKSDIDEAVAAGSDELARTIAAADGFQSTASEGDCVHHYGNVLFNVLRGGIFDDQYRIDAGDFVTAVQHFNRPVAKRHAGFLTTLPDSLTIDALHDTVRATGDRQLERLAYEYLPITFGRRHGDPSRPWNHFTIRLKDADGRRRLSYEGNWRDIFQNWEALAVSYPGFIDGIIAKFVNASTLDGYNPYRITKEGIDWEIEDPDDPWSYIGYWGDHQIIYLLKLLELSRNFRPDRLTAMLDEGVFAYANVPYRIEALDALLADPKNTVVFDQGRAKIIDERVRRLGADGRLVFQASGDVYLVNLIEKLLVPLLAKLSNLVIDGGIWMNTQRPEWNDANNALVGNGLSVVTLCHLRRYVAFLLDLLQQHDGSTSLTAEVADWLSDTAAALRDTRNIYDGGTIEPEQRFAALRSIGGAASRFRHAIYGKTAAFEQTETPVADIRKCLADALSVIDRSIDANEREDGLCHAYNLVVIDGNRLELQRLYPMLEGQVAALSSGTRSTAESIAMLEALFASNLYRDDQHSFMLYPDRELPGFLEKNRISERQLSQIPTLEALAQSGNRRIVTRDADGWYRFHVSFRSARDLAARLRELTQDGELDLDADAILALYEAVFRHREFTGRSGGMFGFEGLGCIYWHMVSKLLLAVQETFFAAIDEGADEGAIQALGALYYRVRAGLGFNKSPRDHGALPMDPYSHTPRHAGARQPGMTGLVKEEILTRFGELGLRLKDGDVRFQPRLLRRREFHAGDATLRYLTTDDAWREHSLPAGSLGFTWCQTPIVLRHDDGATASWSVENRDGTTAVAAGLTLDRSTTEDITRRTGRVRALTVTVSTDLLFGD